MTYSAAVKALEARREVNYRKRVYARLVVEGRMKGHDADYRIDVMEEIARDYEAQATEQDAQARLL